MNEVRADEEELGVCISGSVPLGGPFLLDAGVKGVFVIDTSDSKAPKASIEGQIAVTASLDMKMLQIDLAMIGKAKMTMQLPEGTTDPGGVLVFGLNEYVWPQIEETRGYKILQYYNKKHANKISTLEAELSKADNLLSGRDHDVDAITREGLVLMKEYVMFERYSPNAKCKNIIRSQSSVSLSHIYTHTYTLIPQLKQLAHPNTGMQAKSDSTLKISAKP